MPLSDRRPARQLHREQRRGPATVTVAKPTRTTTRLPLSPALRAQQAVTFKRQIAPYIDGEVEVQVTDNRSIMMSVKRDAKHRRYRLRLHHLFLQAPPDMMQAIASYVVLNARDASQKISSFIEQNDHRVDVASPVRRTVVRTSGRFHDLAQIYKDLKQQYFDVSLETQITWGRNAASGRPRGSIRLGSYSPDEGLIRIHPGLDQAWVPSQYIGWVVFHEMLHAQHPVEIVNGRRRYHTPAFARDERRYEHYDWARSWEHRNIAALLSL